LERLFAAVFEEAVKITNPFAALTKRETASRLAAAMGAEPADAIVRQTQTCWYLSQPRVAGARKRPGVPCGVCAPCIVRRTARPYEAAKSAWQGWRGYSYDLARPRVQQNAKLGLTFRAYLELVDIATTETDDRNMVDQLAPEARALIGGTVGPEEAEIAALIRRFAWEFCETFAVRPAERVT
jgi:hypothetical protein